MHLPVVFRHSSPRRLALAAALPLAALAGLHGCGSSSTSPPTGPGAPAGLAATIAGPVVHLTWSAPARATGVKVVRRLDAAPTGPDDRAATLIYAGSATQADDSLLNLLPDTPKSPRLYHYTVFGCNDSGCEDRGSRAQIAPTVVQCLAAGGYGIYFHHAIATICQDHIELGPASSTSVPNWWQSCETDCGVATARQLSANGIAQATQIGLDLDARRIPVGIVLSSEFCRCVQTAQYMGFGDIQTDPGITYFVYNEGDRCAACMDRLRQVPLPGTDTVIIGHAEFSGTTCSVLNDLTFGEAAIFKPDGAGGITFVTRVLADEWGTLP